MIATPPSFAECLWMNSTCCSLPPDVALIRTSIVCNVKTKVPTLPKFGSGISPFGYSLIINCGIKQQSCCESCRICKETDALIACNHFAGKNVEIRGDAAFRCPGVIAVPAIHRGSCTGSESRSRLLRLQMVLRLLQRLQKHLLLQVRRSQWQEVWELLRLLLRVSSHCQVNNLFADRYQRFRNPVAAKKL